MSDKIIAGFISISYKKRDKKQDTLYHTARNQELKRQDFSIQFVVCLVDKIFLQDQFLCYFDNINLCVSNLRQRKVLAQYSRRLKALEEYK